MSKILCIGEALIDMICTDKGKALSDGENFLKKPGVLLPMWRQLLLHWVAMWSYLPK